MADKTYLFYDIETTGLNKCFDQIIQFAGIRTDDNLNEIERYEYYIRPNKDIIPSPHAFITHRIPWSRLQQGISEYEALKKIHAHFNQPGTISLGYNTLAFDDEFLRFAFYRNLLPPYTHQYANRCQRMDVYPMTLACHLYKNDLLQWPTASLKLDHINQANQFVSGQAHNAMIDVLATLELARVIFKDQATWQYLCGYFDKQVDASRCEVIQRNEHYPVGLMLDGKFGVAQHYQTAVLSLGNHQVYKNQTLWLRLDHPDLQDLTEENFIDKTWVINKKLGEPAMILPMNRRFLKPFLIENQDQIASNLTRLQTRPKLLDSIRNHYQTFTYPKVANVDVAAKLYDDGFMSFAEERQCEQFHTANSSNKVEMLNSFTHKTRYELALRILANQPDIQLPAAVQQQFDDYCTAVKTDRLETLDYAGRQRYSRSQALADIAQLQTTDLDVEQRKILSELNVYLTSKSM